MWIYLLWVICIWVLVGLAFSYGIIYLCRKVEKWIEEGDEEAREMLPLLLQVYAMFDAHPGLLQVVCVLFWPLILYSVFIRDGK